MNLFFIRAIVEYYDVIKFIFNWLWSYFFIYIVHYPRIVWLSSYKYDREDFFNNVRDLLTFQSVTY